MGEIDSESLYCNLDTHQDVTVAVLPFFHIYGFTLTLSLMIDGIKAVTLPKFTPDGYMNCLKDYRPHVLLLVPPIGVIAITL